MCFDRRTGYNIIRIYVIYYWSKILQSKTRFIHRCTNFTMFYRNLYLKSETKSYLCNVKCPASMVQESWRCICYNITWSWRDIAKVKWYWWEHRIYYGKASEGNLPFLDCIIGLNEKREIIPKVHRKPTQTGQYNHFSSNQPLHVKLSTIKKEQRLFALIKHH